MFRHVAERCPGSEIKSQQMGECDLTVEEKEVELRKLFSSNLGNFLRRFGRFLTAEHVKLIDSKDDYEVAYLKKELSDGFDERKEKTKIMNRRFNSLAAQDSDMFFSEDEMRRRNPLLYSDLVERFLTAEEITTRSNINGMEKKGVDSDSNDATSTSRPADETTLSQLLLKCYDERETKKFKEYQRSTEDVEEEDDDDDDDDTETIELRSSAPVSAKEKTLLEAEFRSRMREQFLTGGDAIFGVDLKEIDEDASLDDLEAIGCDAQDKWFDEDDDDDDDDGKENLNDINVITNVVSQSKIEDGEVDYMDFVVEET